MKKCALRTGTAGFLQLRLTHNACRTDQVLVRLENKASEVCVTYVYNIYACVTVTCSMTQHDVRNFLAGPEQIALL